MKDAKEKETSSSRVAEKSETEKQGYSRGKRGHGKRYSHSKAPARNDIAWYNKDPVLLDAVARIPFGDPVGLGNRGNYTTNEIPFNNVDATEAGAMRIALLHGPGVALDASSPINVIANNMYAVVRHMNSRTTLYDAPDLMEYYLAVGELYAMYSQLERAYGTLNLYSGYNRFLPKLLFRAMGFDYDDWVSQRADVLAYAHVLAAQINVFNVPKSLPYYTKLYWAYHHIYADYPLPKAQLYLFTPAVYYQYAPIADTHGGQLSPRPYPSGTNGITFAGFKAAVNNVLKPLLPDQDIGNMSGDVLKAFGESNMLRVGELAPDYRVGITYDEETLWKIHNATFMGPVDIEEAIIRQNVETNLIKWDPRFVTVLDYEQPYVPLFTNQCELDLPMADPDVKAVVESTRLMCTTRIMKWDSGIAVDGAWATRLASSDMLIPCYGLFYGAKVDANGILTYQQFSDMYCGSINMLAGGEYYTVANYAGLLGVISQFRLHPRVTLTACESLEEEDMPEIPVIGWVWDTHNTTTVSAEQIRNMHNACLLSEFGVPLV